MSKYKITEIRIRGGDKVYVPRILLTNLDFPEGKLCCLYYNKNKTICTVHLTDIKEILKLGFLSERGAKELIDCHFREEAQKRIVGYYSKEYKPKNYCYKDKENN